MFNCLPGAMLDMGHTHQCKKGFNCSRVHSQHNARMTASHRLFNPGPPGGKLDWVCTRFFRIRSARLSARDCESGETQVELELKREDCREKDFL